MRTPEQEIEGGREQVRRWVVIDARESPTSFCWRPPMPLVITGVVFSEPVLIEQVVFNIEFLISPPYGQKRVAVPAIYFAQRIFTPNQELRLTLSEPSDSSATLEFSDEALASWLNSQRRAL